MRKRYLVLGASLILAMTLAVPAFGGSDNPVAGTSASTKKANHHGHHHHHDVAHKALTKAKQANRKAKANAALLAELCEPGASAAGSTTCAGVQGQKGETGSQGAAGTPGLQGAAGATGATGASAGGVTHINYTSGADASSTQVFSGNGLTLAASCPTGDLFVNATTAADNAVLNSYSVDVFERNIIQEDDFDTAQNPINIVPNSVDDEVGHLRYTAANGGAVQVEYQADNGPGGVACEFSGVAFFD